MQISGTSSQIQDYIKSEARVQEAEASYQIKLAKMAQQSEAVVGTLLEDTAEISEEAMSKFLAEVHAK